MNRRGFLLSTLLLTGVAGGALGWRNREPLQAWGDRLLGRQKLRTSLLIGGSGTMLELNKALAEGFAKSHPLVDVVVEGGGSQAGLIAVKRGAIDLAAMSRDLSAAEDDPATRGYLVAKDSLVIVVNQNLGVKGLTGKEVRGLFAGEIANWSELGGPDGAVALVSRKFGSTSRQFVEDKILGGEEIAPRAVEAPSAKALLEQVAAGPLAVGYLALKDAEEVPGVAYLEIDGVPPTRPAILSGRYPYSRGLYLVAHGTDAPVTGEFIAFARGSAGQRIVEQQQLVPVG
jgi:phosphate transport system substrate-binding protein